MDRIILGNHANSDLGMGLWVSVPGQNVMDSNTYAGNLSFYISSEATTTRVLQTGTFTLTPGRPRCTPGNTINTWEYGYGVDHIDIPLPMRGDALTKATEIPEVAIFIAWANSSGAYHPYYANTYQSPQTSKGASATSETIHTFANLWYGNTTNDYDLASVDTCWYRAQGLMHIHPNWTQAPDFVNQGVSIAPTPPEWEKYTHPMFASGVRWSCNGTFLSVNGYFTPTFSYVGPNAQNATSLFEFNMYSGLNAFPDCIGEHRISAERQLIDADDDGDEDDNHFFQSKDIYWAPMQAIDSEFDTPAWRAMGVETAGNQFPGSFLFFDENNCGEKPAYLNFHNGISNNMLGEISGNLNSSYGLPYVNYPQPEPEGTPGTSYHDPWGVGMRSGWTVLKGRYIIFNQPAGKVYADPLEET